MLFLLLTVNSLSFSRSVQGSCSAEFSQPKILYFKHIILWNIIKFSKLKDLEWLLSQFMTSEATNISENLKKRKVQG